MKSELQIKNGGKDELVNEYLNLMFFGYIIGGDKAAGEKARAIGNQLARRATLTLASSRDCSPGEPDHCEP